MKNSPFSGRGRSTQGWQTLEKGASSSTAPQGHPAGSTTWIHSVLQHKYFTAKSVCLAGFSSYWGHISIPIVYLKCAGTGTIPLSEGFGQLTFIHQHWQLSNALEEGSDEGKKLQSNNGFFCPKRAIVSGRVLLGKLTWELLKLSPELCSSGRFSSHHPRVVNFPFWIQSVSEGKLLETESGSGDHHSTWVLTRGARFGVCVLFSVLQAVYWHRGGVFKL